MAKLPDLQTQDRPTPQPVGGFASYRADFGGGEMIGQATTQLGQQIGRAGDELYAQAKIEQERIDTLKAEEAFTKLRQRQLDLTMGETEGYSRLRGAQAVNTPIFEHYSKKYQDAQLEIENSLKTSDQLAKFRSRASMGFVQFQEGLLRHKNQESDSYAKEVTEGTIQTEMRQATANWNSSIDVGVSLVRIEGVIRDQAERMGMPNEQADAMILKAKGQVHSSVIQQALASGNMVFAQEWFEKNKKDIDAPTAKALETATRNGYQKQLGAQYDAAFLAARDDPQQLRALEASVLKDQTLDEDRKNRIHGRILSRQDALAKQAELGANRIEKYVERSLTKIDGDLKAGYEPPAQEVENLYELTKGTPMEGEYRRVIRQMEATRQFRNLPLDQQAQEITRMTLEARGGMAVDAKIKFAPAIEKHGATIDEAAQRFSVNPMIMRAQIMAESGGNEKAVSPMGAQGISQFIPGTAKRYGVNVNDPRSSIFGQANYMSDLLKMFDGDYAKALAGYNWGEGYVQQAIKKATEAGTPDKWLNRAPKETRDYVAKIMEMSGGARAARMDMAMVKTFEQIHENLKRDLKEDPTTTAFRQGWVPNGDPALTPIDMSKPEALNYQVLSRRGELSAAVSARYGAPEKLLTVPEVAVAVNTLRRSDVDGRVNYFANLLKVAQNRGPDAQGMRDDQGGARRFQSIMAQIAPDEPVLAFAGVAAGAWGDSGAGRQLSELIIKGHAILNPNQRTDGKPAGGSLIPMPAENKMRLEFDNMVGDALRSNPQYESTAYQAARAVYVAMPGTSSKGTGELDTARWQEAIKMTVGNVHDHNGKMTVLPTGFDLSRFKDEVKNRSDALIASGRLADTMTAQKLRNMQLRPAGFDRYVFTEGDTVLSDKRGMPVVLDFKMPAPWTPSAPIYAAPQQATAAELQEAQRPYFGNPTKRSRGAN